LDKTTKQKRNRIIALSFVSVLLLLVYGPLSLWFVAADRALYDRIAGGLKNQALSNAYIVSIDSQRDDPVAVMHMYGTIIQTLQNAKVGRIVLANPPTIAASEDLPEWKALLTSDVPVFVPTRHRLSEVAPKNGFVDVRPDPDGVLRRSDLWQLNSGVMSPSLPLAIAFNSPGTGNGGLLGSTDDAIFFSSYSELPRIDTDVLTSDPSIADKLDGATVFVDADPEVVGQSAVLPSGQFVTWSEITATLLANVENGETIVTPSSIKALEYLIPALLAIVAVLFLPDRNRRQITILTVGVIFSMLLIEWLLLYAFHIRIDLGRPIVIFLGVALLCAWLVIDDKKVSGDAFKKGAGFLAAGRLEPAFAEFRRCNPSETIAAVMYKLSLSFEQQAKPERAEAVLEWMKRTQGTVTAAKSGSSKPAGVPQRLGRYLIERRIGRGAMGAVYLAKDPRINRPVAVKAIPIEKEFEDDELREARLRFYREAESAGRLTHPNIITVFDAGEDKGLAYIAMEYVPGIALKEFTDKTKLLAPKRALELCAATAEGLDFAHNQGVIHRDIKPANLLYNPKDGTVKISDFGVAQMTDNNKTKTGIVLGTPMYMSPEQLGAEDLTGLSDLFSLGVTLYELLIGEVPFKATNIAVLMTKITTEDPAPVSSRRAGIAPSVDAVLMKAMAKRPPDRFSCGAEMAIALRNCARFS